MKMTNKEVVGRHSSLVEAGKKTLPRKIGYAIAKNIVKIEEEIQLIVKQGDDIKERYALKDEKGRFKYKNSHYQFKTVDDEKAFDEEFKELDNVEVDIDIYKIKASDLDTCEKNERYDILTPLQEASLAWMIDYDN